MIISRTPLRISFCGGGTDLKNYWEDHNGAVVSATIDKYIYIISKQRSDDEIWLKYSQNEIVRNLDDITHTRWRECLKMTGIKGGIEMCAMSDVPKGTGLGGSSSFTVGSLNSLYGLTEKLSSKENLAREACNIEIDVLSEPIGKQDQYATAYGGLNLIEFQSDGSVNINPINLSDTERKEFSSNLLLFNLNISREASFVLSEQNKNTKAKAKILHKMKEFAYATKEAICNKEFYEFGRLLHENWKYKKKMSEKISNRNIDRHYEAARDAGALGGKICGAGAGGFLLFYVEPEKQKSVRNALGNLTELKFDFENSGSEIIFGYGDAKV